MVSSISLVYKLCVTTSLHPILQNSAFFTVALPHLCFFAYFLSAWKLSTLYQNPPTGSPLFKCTFSMKLSSDSSLLSFSPLWVLPKVFTFMFLISRLLIWNLLVTLRTYQIISYKSILKTKAYLYIYLYIFYPLLKVLHKYWIHLHS